MYSLTGHGTTAGTLAYSIFLLVAYPQWQKWIAEEIHYVLDGQGSHETWECERLSP